MNNTAKTVRNSAAAAKKVAQFELGKVRESAKDQLGVPTEVGQQRPESSPFGQKPEDGEDQLDQMKAENEAKSRQLLEQLNAELAKHRQARDQQKLVEQQREAQAKVQIQQQQEEAKKETRFQKAVKGIKRRIAGKREMKQGPSG